MSVVPPRRDAAPKVIVIVVVTTGGVDAHIHVVIVTLMFRFTLMF